MAHADELKVKAAAAALDLVESGMTLGLGTGSTAAKFIAALGARRIDVRGVPTSEEARRAAEAAGIALIEPDETTVIDLAVDGTDEIDLRGDCIKGGGGALLREKIVAFAARRFIVIADGSKRVAQLGSFPLPVEISTFSWGLTMRALREKLSAQSYAPRLTLRYRDGAPVMTDGGNYIVDCNLQRIHDAAMLDRALLETPGVVASGLFVGLCDAALIASPAGVETMQFVRRRL